MRHWDCQFVSSADIAPTCSLFLQRGKLRHGQREPLLRTSGQKAGPCCGCGGKNGAGGLLSHTCLKQMAKYTSFPQPQPPGPQSSGLETNSLTGSSPTKCVLEDCVILSLQLGSM